MPAVRDAYAFHAAREGKPVSLPGFNLAWRGDVVSPFQWAVPKPADEGQLLNVYEEYVDRPLGTVNRPEAVARKLFKSRQVGRRYFGHARPAARWRVPAIKLVLAAAHFGAVVRKTMGCYSVELGGYSLSVRRSGCHSNVQDRMLTLPRDRWDKADAEFELYVLRRVSAHPLARALKDAGADASLLWAASSVLASGDRVSAEDVLGDAPGHLTEQQRNVRLEEIRLAHAAAVEIAEGMASDTITALYGVMVPALCSASRFKKLVGNPWTEYDRAPSGDTRRKWVERVEELAAEAHDAVA